MRPHRASVLALAAALLATPARAQILDRVLEKAEQAKEVADKVGTAVVPISTEQEIEIGRGIAATVAGRYGVVRDTALTRYVSLVGLGVASVDPRPGIAYRFAILDTDEINAFAAPGGYVFVTRGALELMDDEATLAGVLAHEIGHVDARDVIEEIQDKARTRLGIEEAGERIDVTGERYLRKAVETGAEALFMGLSREDELDADAFAVEHSAETGYDPEGIRRFVAALAERYGAEDDDVSLLEKTHPDPEDRLDTIREALDDLPDRNPRPIRAADRFHGVVRGR